MTDQVWWWDDPNIHIEVDDVNKADIESRDPGVDWSNMQELSAVRDDAAVSIQDQIAAMLDIAREQYQTLNALLSSWDPSSRITVDPIGTDVDLTEPPHIDWSPHTVRDIESAAFEVIPPVFDVDKPDGVEYEEPAYSSDLFDALVAKLINDIQESSSGIDPKVEEALYDRAVNKLNAEMNKQQQDTEDYFASKGFHLPPGALSGRLLELQNGNIKAHTDLLNDIIVQRSNLVQQNIQTLISGANNLEGLLRQTFDSVQNRELTKAQAISTASVEVYNAEIKKYLADVQKYQQDISHSIESVKHALGIEDLRVRASGIHAESEARRVDAWARREGVKIERARLISGEKVAEMQADVSAQIEGFRLYAEQMKAQASVLGQIAASALSTFNTNMSYGVSAGLSGSISMGSSWSASENLSMSQTLQNSKSLGKNTGISYSSSTRKTESFSEAHNTNESKSDNWMYHE